jgi:enamine deaminase RidA (YjgF/YER057c/UK114 family)
VRDSRRVQAPDYSAPASRLGFSDELTFLSFIVAKDLDKDVKGQTKEIVDEIDRLLAKCGSGKTKLLSALIWLTDIRNRAPMNEVWTAWVDPKNMPARACVEAKLADPNALVEIMVIAAK